MESTAEKNTAKKRGTVPFIVFIVLLIGSMFVLKYVLDLLNHK